MPPDLSNNQELALKKRARRRLVGAIALVLLMVIVLPMILKDRAALVQQEAIKITMPASSELKTSQQAVVAPVETPQVSSAAIKSIKSNDVNSAVAADVAKPNNKVNANKSDVVQKSQATKEDKKALLKAKEPEAKAAEIKTQPKPASSFALQIGVYSDMDNVKQLQENLTQAGYKAHLEQLSTPKGEKFRIKAGNFSSRQEAAYALTKLQKVGLPGMVIANE